MKLIVAEHGWEELTFKPDIETVINESRDSENSS